MTPLPAPPPPVSALGVLVRGLRCRCPVCGRGRVFVSRVVSARVCGDCGWQLERCVGHWIGGNEVNVVVTFTAGIAAWLLCLPVVGLGLASTVIATAFTGVFAVAFYRPSRGLFFSLDYLLDPTPDVSIAPPPDGTDRRPGRDLLSPSPPRGPRGGPARAASAPAAAPAPVSSESFIPPSPAPYPPPATVSP